MQNTILSPTPDLLPAGCTVRTGQMADYRLVFELVNTYAQKMNGSQELDNPELIRQDWQHIGFNPETDMLLVFDAQGCLLGVVETWLINQPPVHPWNGIRVHPDHLQEGIWEYLLLWGERRSATVLQSLPAGLRMAPRTGVEHHNLEAIRAIQNLGWTPVRSYYRMVTDLETAPEVPAVPAGISLRTYNPATETEAVYRAVTEAFKDHFGYVEQPFEAGFANFKHSMINLPGYDPNYWFVAMDGEEIAGFCLCRPVDDEDAECGFVNELGVRRAWRKRGLGTLLLKHAFAAFYARGQKRAALGVDASSLTGALRIYERAGMRVARQFDHFEKELRPGQEISTQNLA